MPKLISSIRSLGVACLMVAGGVNADERVLITPSYELKMDSRCVEGEVSCNQYTLQGRERHNGEAAACTLPVPTAKHRAGFWATASTSPNAAS